MINQSQIRAIVYTVREIVSYDDYDALVMILNGRSINFGFADDKYKFTGKELDTETEYFHFGARAYDGRLGRWNVVDPLFEKYPNVNPYNYALNNPLKFIDPNGMWVDENSELNLGDDGKFFAEKPKSKKKKQTVSTTTKNSTGETTVVNIGGSFALLFGVNFNIGVATSNNSSYLYARYGLSFGLGYSFGISEASLDQNLEDSRGDNNHLDDSNSSNLEFDISALSLNAMFDSKDNGGILRSISPGFGVGVGFFYNTTWQSAETKNVNKNLLNPNTTIGLMSSQILTQTKDIRKLPIMPRF